MNHIDKVFKHKLQHYHVDIPEGAWENIASRLPEPAKKFRPWWAISSILTVLLFAGLTSYIMSDFTPGNQDVIKNINYNSRQNTDFAQSLNTAKSKKDIQSTQINDIKFVDDINTPYNASSNISKSKVTYSKNINQAYTPLNDIFNDNSADLVDGKTDVKFEHRNPENIAVLSSNLKELIYEKTKNIKARNKFFKEKQVKACPFVLDIQDKSVDVYFSHDKVSKVLTSNPGSEDYRNMRATTEQPMYSFSAGARFGYNLSYRWNLHTGFNYSQINEKFEYVDPESNQTRIITIKDYVYDNGKIIDSIVTQQTVLVPGTTSHIVYNKYRTFDIPVLGRYTLYANKYLSLSAVAGIYFNVSMLQRGMILDANNNKPISLNSKDDEGYTMFKTQLGLTGYGSLSLAYHITNRIDFLLEPNIRMQTASMTNNQYPLDQRLNTYSLSTGLRYKF